MKRRKSQLLVKLNEISLKSARKLENAEVIKIRKNMELHTDASNPLEIKKCCKISLLAKLGVDTVENTRRKGPQNRHPFTGPEGEILLHRKPPDRR